MKNIFKIFGKIIIILFYFIISVIKFCTVKVILYDAPITGIYFATNLFNENKIEFTKGFVIYNCKSDYNDINPKAHLLVQNDEFYDPIYDFLVGKAWAIISIIFLLNILYNLIKKYKEHLTRGS